MIQKSQEQNQLELKSIAIFMLVSSKSLSSAPFDGITTYGRADTALAVIQHQK